MHRFTLHNASGQVIATAKGKTPQDIADSFSRMARGGFTRVDTGERYQVINGHAVNVSLIAAIERMNHEAMEAAA